MENKIDNELIAEFMEFTPENHGWRTPIGFVNCAYSVVRERLLFDTSWDWLMSVVEKIDSLPEIDFEMYPAYKATGERCGVVVKIRTSPGEILVLPQDRPRIKVVYRAILEFIKWYNSSQPPK